MSTNEWRQHMKPVAYGIRETRKKKEEAEVQNTITLKSGGEKVNT